MVNEYKPLKTAAARSRLLVHENNTFHVVITI